MYVVVALYDDEDDVDEGCKREVSTKEAFSIRKRKKKNVGDVIKNRHEKLALRRDRMALVCFVVFLSIRRLSATRLFPFFKHGSV